MTTTDPNSLLIVDDNDFFAATMTLIARNEFGFRSIDVARSGAAALRALQPDAPVPSVIFMDFDMPEANGLETARALRLSGCRTTIVLLTAADTTSLAHHVHAQHVDAIVSKAAIPQSLSRVLTRLFPRCTRFRSLEEHQ